MAHWLSEFPAIRVMPKQLAAEDYNRIRLSLLRERLPWRIPLHDMRCLTCILDETNWVCIDECHNSQPILAWTNFQSAQRQALNAPVACELHLFHMHAGLVMGPALEALIAAVTQHQKEHAIYNQLVAKLDT